MALVPRSTSVYRALSRDLDRQRFYQPSDFALTPSYLWDDPRVWWPRDTMRPLDELVTRRVRNQLIQSTPHDWAWPMRWQDYYAGERVFVDEKGFQVDMDVRQFKPHEIVVKTTDDYVVVHGNHEKRNDGNGVVERHFVRKYMLPRGFNANEVISNLSADGILTIKAPPPPPTKYYSPSERLVQIHETGKLASLLWK